MTKALWMGLMGMLVFGTWACSNDNDDGTNFSPGPDATPEDSGSDEEACGNTSIDVQNCGRCYHRCDEGICRDGQCMPATVVAQGQKGPAHLLVLGTRIFWANCKDPGQVLRRELSGGSPEVIANTDFSVLSIKANRVALFWAVAGSGFAADGSIMRWNLDGSSPPITVADGLAYPSDLVVDEEYVYWVNTDGNNVMKVPVDGGNPVQIASGADRPMSIALGPDAVYWTSGMSFTGSIMSVPLAGGTPQVFASDLDVPRGMVADQTNLYWSNAYSFGAIHKQPLAGGAKEVLSTFYNGNGEIAIDDTFVYYSQQDLGNRSATVIYKVPIAGGDAVAMATHTSTAYPHIGMDVDDTRIYWADFNKGLILATEKEYHSSVKILNDVNQ